MRPTVAGVLVRARWAWSLGAVLLTACGAQPMTQLKTSTPMVASHPVPLPVIGVPVPGGAPANAPGATPNGAADPAHAALQKAMDAFHALPAFEANMSFMQKQGDKSASGSYRLAGKQPRTLRLEVVEGTGQGTKLLWTGGKTVKVRPAGLLGAITVDLPQDDDRLKSVRGYTLEDTDFPAFFTQFGDPANHLAAPSVTGEGLQLTVTGPRLLKGVASMTGTFDPNTLMPRKIEMSDGKQVVLRFVVTNFHAVPSISLSI